MKRFQFNPKLMQLFPKRHTDDADPRFLFGNSKSDKLCWVYIAMRLCVQHEYPCLQKVDDNCTGYSS